MVSFFNFLYKNGNFKIIEVSLLLTFPIFNFCTKISITNRSEAKLLLSVPERALICFRLSFLAAAALWSPLNISLIIRRFQTIFGSYIP